MLKIICPDKKLVPTYATDGSGGLDLKLAIDVRIAPKQVVKVPTGVKMEIPAGFIGIIGPRSSTGGKDLQMSNTIGWIDSDYQGEIFIPIKNVGRETFLGYKYDALFQMVIVPYERAKFILVDKFDTVTERGEGGFGSTDKE